MNSRFILIYLFFVVFLTEANSYRLVAYWGQNGGNSEKELNYYCTNSAYDIVVIGFVDRFEHPENKDNYPTINLSKHCGLIGNSAYPKLLSCEQFVKAAIGTCRTNKKRVYISLGGATKTYGLESEEKAQIFAKRVWDLFLGGKDNVRPFGDVILDGVDLDIEHESTFDGYPKFLETLHNYIKNDTTRKYYVSGAPQCPFPDKNMKGVLEKQGHLFDEIFIQYYNNPGCSPGIQGSKFEENFETWVNFTKSINSKKTSGSSLKVFLGLPAHQDASGRSEYYKPPAEVATIFNKVKKYSEFGGMMLWDAGYDTKNIIHGSPYSKHVKDILQTGVYNPVLPTAPPKAKVNQKIVTFWGQNGGGGEQDLSTYCSSSTYDTIVIGFINKFFDTSNKRSYPGINLSKHCGFTSNTDYPSLFQCPASLNNAILSCQRSGKKVLIALGGSVISYKGIPSDDNATELANRIWNLFLGGSDEQSLRPFGSNVVLDGIDLNIENSSKTGHDGYPKFVLVLHKLMRTDTSKSYYITASPKCTFPDPNIGNTLQHVGYLFDELHIQYFSKDCYFGSSNFGENILKWVTFVRNIAKTHNDSALNSILIGLPAHKNMSSDEKYYQRPEDVATLIKNVSSYSEVSGVTLWDAGYDELNKINGYRYSEIVKTILKNNGTYDPNVTAKPTTVLGPSKIVGYWGQNGGNMEKGLNEYCTSSVYDIIIIGFVDVFFDTRNKDSYPSINLSKHCGQKVHNFVTLLSCPAIGTAIKQCQENKKQVFISIGGATKGYVNNINGAQRAKEFATRIWNLFLGGKATPSYRPFGDAILDGVDLDIEHEDSFNGYPIFTKALYDLMQTDTSKKYYISGAPQCPYPDKNMKGALSETGHLFDEIYIQYYNNYCYPGTEHFRSNFETWVQHVRNLKIQNPDSKLKKIFVGLPAHSYAAGGNGIYYKKPNAVKEIYEMVKSYPEFGGFMLWDIGYDELNKETNNKPYSYAVASVINHSSLFSTTPSPDKEFKMAGFWGSNRISALRRNENNLAHYCSRKSYDIIIIDALTIFFDNQNANMYPALNFARHCFTTFGSNYKTYLRCPNIASWINSCQARGKKILLSIGSGTRFNGFTSTAQAEQFANTLWNLFLGGVEVNPSLRTFGSTKIDGIDIDIHSGEKSYYADFVNKLREKMDTSTDKKYLLSASPKCLYPNRILEEAYEKHSDKFDYLFLDTDETTCNLKNENKFISSLTKWLAFPGPEVFFTIPAEERVAIGKSNYLTRIEVNAMIQKYMTSYERIRGIALNDVGYDDINIKDGVRYSDYIGEKLKPNAYTTPKPLTTKTPDRNRARLLHASLTSLIGIVLAVVFVGCS